MRPHRRQPTRFLSPWDSLGKNTGVGCHFFLQCMKVKSENEVAQSCPTLSDPMDWSPPGSSVNGIFQARVLEWGAIAFSSFVRGVCNFLSSVSPQQKFEAVDQCYSSVLFGKQRKIHPQGGRMGQPKRREELNFGSFLIFFLLPLNLPCVNWASQEGCLFHLRSSLWSLDLPLFYFCGLFPFFVF